MSDKKYIPNDDKYPGVYSGKVDFNMKFYRYFNTLSVYLDSGIVFYVYIDQVANKSAVSLKG